MWKHNDSVIFYPSSFLFSATNLRTSAFKYYRLKPFLLRSLKENFIRNRIST